jgi:L-lysine 6-transaminase
MVSNRVDEVKENVFNIPSRLNSTWGGNLVDMVRCQKYLEIIEKEHLVKNAEMQGKRLLQGIEAIEQKYPQKITNARGRGLMCAFDLPTSQKRGELKNKLYANNLLILTCGAVTIRFRPPLTISSEEIDEALEIVEKTVKTF